MKRIFTACFLIVFFFFHIVITRASDKEVLVVYFSRDGHTHMVAQKLAEAFDADIERLRDQKERTGMIGTLSAGKDAMAHNVTEIEPLANNPNDYSVILIGTPAWFSNMAPAVRTFIEQFHLTDKTIGLFSTCHRIGADKATQQMAELISAEKAAGYARLPLTHHDLEEGMLAEKIKQFESAINAQRLNE